MKKLRNAVLMFIVVFLLLLEFRNFKLIDALVQRTNQQTNHTQQLEQEVKQLETVNARLESNIVYQHNLINKLSNKPTKIEYITQPVKQEEPKEEEHSFEAILKPDFTTITVGALATLGGMVKILIPQF